MFKIVISIPEEKRAVQIEKDVPTFIGMKIGDRFDGSMIGLVGYTLEITGGSDKDGFPMRRDLPGTARKKVLLTRGVGCRVKGKGVRVKKTIRGNRIAEDISQVNVKIVEKKPGAKSVYELLGLEKPEEKAGEAKEGETKPEEKEKTGEGKAEEKKEESKEEAKEEKQEEKK